MTFDKWNRWLFAPATTEETLGAGGDNETTEEENPPENEEEPSEESEDSDDEEEEEDTTPNYGADDNTIRQALDLYNKLQNPQTAPGVLTMLNKVVPGGVTKEEIENISVSDIIKEALGEEFSILGDKLPSAIEKAVNKIVEAKTSNLVNGLQQAQQQIAATRISSILDPMIEQMGAEEFDKLVPELNKVIAKYPLQQGADVKTYLNDMIKMVKVPDSKKSDKIQKNARAAKRPQAGVNPERVKVGSKTPTIREAVELAMQGKVIDD